MFNDFELILTDTKDFIGHVTRVNEPNSYHCELQLSPKGAKIKLIGTIGESRDFEPKIIHGEINGDINNSSLYFISYNNKFSKIGANFRTNLEINEFNPEYVIISDKYLKNDIGIRGFSLQYNDFDKYIGDTAVQQQQLESDDPLAQSPVEITISNADSNFLIGYNFHTSFSSWERAKRLIPVANVSYSEPQNTAKIIDEVKAYMSLFSFMKGGENTPRLVKLALDLPPPGNNYAFLYLPTSSETNHGRDHYVLPLCRNNRHPFFYETPDVFFENFLNDVDDIRTQIRHLVKCFSYSYSEERFLQIFRVVETFLEKHNVPYLTEEEWNAVKGKFTEAVTEIRRLTPKHIKGFIASIGKNANRKTSSLSRFKIWKYVNEPICKALDITDETLEQFTLYRNDLTHGRGIACTDDELLFCIIRLEILSVYCILQSLQYPGEHLVEASCRWPGYGRVAKRNDTSQETNNQGDSNESFGS